MKKHFTIFTRTVHAALLWSSLLGLAMTAAQAAEQTSSPKPSNTSPKSAPIQVPLSEFTIPNSTTEGRDPFFPQSARVRTSLNTATNIPTRALPGQLVLQGISVVGTNRFALINGRTFIPNEDGEVPAGNGKVQLLCVSIREDVVVVEVNGVRQELRLRPGR